MEDAVEFLLFNKWQKFFHLNSDEPGCLGTGSNAYERLAWRREEGCPADLEAGSGKLSASGPSRSKRLAVMLHSLVFFKNPTAMILRLQRMKR